MDYNQLSRGISKECSPSCTRKEDGSPESRSQLSPSKDECSLSSTRKEDESPESRSLLSRSKDDQSAIIIRNKDQSPESRSQLSPIKDECSLSSTRKEGGSPESGYQISTNTDECSLSSTRTEYGSPEKILLSPSYYELDSINASISKLSLDESVELKPETVIMREELTLHGIAKFISDGHCKNIITMVGAGISTSAGIPDFRTPGSGLYYNLQKYNLPYTGAIFDLDYFVENPEPFYMLAKELLPGSYKPTVCHYFIRLLHQKNLLLRHYTQNIDNLERLAGLPSEVLVEAHGTFYVSHCIKCGLEYSFEWFKEIIDSSDEVQVPRCTKCYGLIKPNIIFFGEQLPKYFYSRMKRDFQNCDLLIIMGSSLIVEPFASLLTRVPETCPRLVINNEKVGMNLGLKYLCPDNTRDAIWLGSCDSGCKLLAHLLGWNDELNELLQSTNV